MWPIIQDPLESVILMGDHSKTKNVWRIKKDTRKYPGRKNKLLNKVMNKYILPYSHSYKTVIIMLNSKCSNTLS